MPAVEVTIAKVHFPVVILLRRHHLCTSLCILTTSFSPDSCYIQEMSFLGLRSTEGGASAAGGAAPGGDAPTGENGEIVGGPRGPQQVAAQKRMQQTQAQVDEVWNPTLICESSI